ncbi:hypothetical protein Q4E93_22085 [Flavitalea sp. BT771]|uniref:hypothetical protein n=1 Tax=Flavitalea sp. BT771 TaxID=3063329 RepID=UPI0026E2549F|nr:hypothetical protein [Flavitalea sp. BT771]MDO6433317.1 hypothetical protein [Flavitalea sp. BT771]MDV6222778.1 hypothetical protein [Flavitalea sp. BT771]
MAYTLQKIDNIKTLIKDSTGKTSAVALHLRKSIWNIFTPDYKKLIVRCDEGKKAILPKFQASLGRTSANQQLQ